MAASDKHEGRDTSELAKFLGRAKFDVETVHKKLVVDRAGASLKMRKALGEQLLAAHALMQMVVVPLEQQGVTVDLIGITHRHPAWRFLERVYCATYDPATGLPSYATGSGTEEENGDGHRSNRRGVCEFEKRLKAYRRLDDLFVHSNTRDYFNLALNKLNQKVNEGVSYTAVIQTQFDVMFKISIVDALYKYHNRDKSATQGADGAAGEGNAALPYREGYQDNKLPEDRQPVSDRL